nr:carboxypeptidase-like regulatory domain-containing protein [uncultured Mucilaginibacter sp.]
MLAKVLYKIALLALLLPVHLFAQVIKGRVTDEITGKPLENVNVYLNGTYQGTTTDSLGNFILNNTLKTSAAIIISYVGYQEQRISDYTNEAIKTALKRKAIALKEVVIEPDDYISRARAMRIFLDEFIGYSNCVINNPDDIYFHYNKKKDRLIAGADKPLLINNKMLGYTVTYFLNDFRRTPTQTTYKGNYFFSEDTARLSAKKVKQIMQARDKAYYGSRMHFIRALWANELEKNNFSIYAKLKGFINYDHTYTQSELNALSYNRIIENVEGKKFVLLGKAEVDEAKFDKDGAYIIYSTDTRVFHSFMQQKSGMDGVIIDSNGYHDEGLQSDGTFGIERVGELLPFEFQPAA